MSKAEPTAGEWLVETSGFVTADGEIICDASAYVQKQHWLPNARLFAASKDLLAACERAELEMGLHCIAPITRELLRAAIAKAKGGGVSEQLYCIQDTRSYVGNAVVWWRSTRNGYTCHIDEALIVGREEARRMHKDRKTDKAWPVNKIKKAMSLQVDAQRLR